jgi:hypothetical protein
VTGSSLRRWVLLVGLAAGLLIGTCVVPYLFPPREFVVGASFEVGFNNSVSFLIYLGFIPLLILATARIVPEPLSTQSETDDRSPRVFLFAVGSVVLAHILLFSAVYAYKGRFVFAESLYFQSLLYRMTQGEVPYLDFGFFYGPLMLYPGYWLTRAFGLDAGYGVWFVANYVVGLLFLAALVRVCLPSVRAATFWFAFLAFGLFNPLTGLNVTLTRYLFPSVVFLAVTRFLRDGGWSRGVVATTALAAAFLYSFEVASLALGAVLVLIAGYVVSGSKWMPTFWRVIGTPWGKERLEVSVSPRRFVSRGILVLVVAAIASVGSFLSVDPSGRALSRYPEIARSYSGGAYSIPLYPHLPFLTLVAVTVVAVTGLTLVVRQTGDVALLPPAIAYVALALATERAAFGVAEPNRMAYYGLPVVLVALFVTGHFARQHTGRRVLAGMLLLGMMLPLQYYGVTEFLPFIEQRLQAQTPSTSAAATEPVASGADVERNLREIVQVLGRDRPYLMYDMDYNSLPVYRDLHLRYPTYAAQLMTTRNHAGIEEAIDQIREKHAIVVARKQDLDSPAEPARSVGVRRLLDLVSGAQSGGSNLSAVQLKSKRRLMAPLLDFLQFELVPLYEHNGFIAFGPKSDRSRG